MWVKAVKRSKQLEKQHFLVKNIVFDFMYFYIKKNGIESCGLTLRFFISIL